MQRSADDVNKLTDLQRAGRRFRRGLYPWVDDRCKEVQYMNI